MTVRRQSSVQEGRKRAIRSSSNLIPQLFLPSRETKNARKDVSDAIKSLQRKLRTYLPRKKVANILRVCRFAVHAHGNQKRASGEPYIIHPISVASMVADMHMDADAVSAALLHDVVEDTEVSLEMVEKEFGHVIATLTEGLTKLRSIKKKPISVRNVTSLQSANHQKLVVAMVGDPRVILIKLSDRLHNLRTIEALPIERRRKIAKETMLIYAPLAGRLGMEKLRMELEDLSFAAAYPMRHRIVKNLVELALKRRKNYIEDVIERVRSCLKKNSISGEVYGRQKNLAGIYNKITRRASEWIDAYNTHSKEYRSLHEIMDVHGVRIVTKKVEDCYRALGALHAQMRPIQGRFKDYIANPKKNGYQSLHTTLIGPSGYPLEIQIRSREMNEVAETGIAAHFLYKTRFFGKKKGGIKPMNDVTNWLANVVSKNTQGDEIIENLKIELSPNEIYVYTPTGDIINLPQGACAIDFAYALHTEMGTKCVACEIDNKSALITSPLETGQVIRIITDENASPEFSWRSYAITPKALSHISMYARMRQATDVRFVGEKMLEDALRVYRPDAVIQDISESRWKEYLSKHNLSTRDMFYDLLCWGKLTPLVAAYALLGTSAPSIASKEQAQDRLSLGIHKGSTVLHCANCCKPIPGDTIVVLPTKLGIQIHRTVCHNVKDKHKKQCLPAHWGNGGNEKSDKFLTAIRCDTQYMPDVISRIVSRLAANNISLESIITEDSGHKTRTLALELWVYDRDHLAGIIRRLRIIRDITSITRIL